MSYSLDDSPNHSHHTRDPQVALQTWFAQHRVRLRMVLEMRMDRRLNGRLDPSDVLQETWLDASSRVADYVKNPGVNPYLWLRFLAIQQLLIAHRRHLQTQCRDATREVGLEISEIEVSCEGLAHGLIDSGTSPSQFAAREEDFARLHEALSQLEARDREVLALRHFEQLGNEEMAQVLGIPCGSASVRYFRALKRLKDLYSPIG